MKRKDGEVGLSWNAAFMATCGVGGGWKSPNVFSLDVSVSIECQWCPWRTANSEFDWWKFQYLNTNLMEFSGFMGSGWFLWNSFRYQESSLKVPTGFWVVLRTAATYHRQKDNFSKVIVTCGFLFGGMCLVTFRWAVYNVSWTRRGCKWCYKRYWVIVLREKYSGG